MFSSIVSCPSITSGSKIRRRITSEKTTTVTLILTKIIEQTGVNYTIIIIHLCISKDRRKEGSRGTTRLQWTTLTESIITSTTPSITAKDKVASLIKTSALYKTNKIGQEKLMRQISLNFSMQRSALLDRQMRISTLPSSTIRRRTAKTIAYWTTASTNKTAIDVYASHKT